MGNVELAESHTEAQSPGKDPASENLKKFVIGGRYQLEDTIGKGKYGKVKRALDLMTRQYVAVKIIRKIDGKNEAEQAAQRRLLKEIAIHELLNHPHIVRIYTLLHSIHHLYVVMELCPKGEIFDYIVAHGRLRDSEVRTFFRQALSAVAYCHSVGVAHRDLKLENILLSQPLHMKLADFGFASAFDQDRLLETFCGTAAYAAPEILNGRAYNGPAADVWSMGVLLYCFVVGGMPTSYSHPRDIKEALNRGERYLPSEHLSGGCKALVDRMLSVDPNARPCLDDLCTDGWVTDCGKLPAVTWPIVEPTAATMATAPAAYIERLVTMGLEREDVEGALAWPGTTGAVGTGSTVHATNGTTKMPANVRSIRCLYTLVEKMYATSSDPGVKGEHDGDATQHARRNSLSALAAAVGSPAARPPRRRRANTYTPLRPETPSAPSAAASFTDTPPPPTPPLFSLPDSDVADDAPPAALPHSASIPIAAPAITVSPTRTVPRFSNLSIREELGDPDGPLSKKFSQSVPNAPMLPPPASTPHSPSAALPPLAVPRHLRSSLRSAAPGTPRSIRAAFSAHTTSALPPDELLTRLRAALRARSMRFTEEGFTLTVDADSVQLEVEVCVIPMLSLHYLRFRRLLGGMWDYLRVHHDIVAAVQWH